VGKGKDQHVVKKSLLRSTMKRQENENDRKAFPNKTDTKQKKIWHRAKRRKIIAIRRLFVAFSLLEKKRQSSKVELVSADKNKPTMKEKQIR
jgi:hypothetical protein